MNIALRFVFAAALVGVSALIGRARAGKLALRAGALSELLGMARQLEAMIRVNSLTIPDALAECARRLEGRWTGRLAETLSRLYGARAAVSGLWLAALGETAKDFEEAAALKEEDGRAISFFGDQLASSDMKAITENFGLLYERIGECLREAERECAVKGRLYNTVGMLAGLAAAIVVI